MTDLQRIKRISALLMQSAIVGDLDEASDLIQQARDVRYGIKGSDAEYVALLACITAQSDLTERIDAQAKA